MNDKIKEKYWNGLRSLCREMNAPLEPNPTHSGNRIGVNLGPNLKLGLRVESVINAEVPGVNSTNIAIRISIRQLEWNTVTENRRKLRRNLRGNLRGNFLYSNRSTGE